MSHRLTIILVSIILSAGLMSSCSKSEKMLQENNPFYIRGVRLRQDSRYQKAAEAFRKCLRLTPEATQAHLQLAMLYDDHLGKPIQAMYHYQLFIDNSNNAKNVDIARQSLQKLQESYAKNILNEAGGFESAQKSETTNKRIKELIRQKRIILSKLKEVNADLIRTRQRLTAALGKEHSVSSNTDQRSEMSEEKRESPRQGATEDVRTHTVQRGDTLIKLCRKYYGTGQYWDELLRYNTTILHGDTTLKPGMKLRIPAAKALKEYSSQ